jgi:WD40 repeat protein
MASKRRHARHHLQRSVETSPFTLSCAHTFFFSISARLTSAHLNILTPDLPLYTPTPTSDTTTILWDASTGERMRILREHFGWV